jgi:acetyl-CoA synthetase
MREASMETPGAGAIAWAPSPAVVARSRLQSLLGALGVRDLDELQARAEADPAWYWDAAVRHLGLEWYRPYEQVVDLSAGKPWARWFVGGEINWVHNALDRHAATAHRDAVALIWEGEEGEARGFTFGELQEAVNRFANALLALGVRRGDHVGLYLPMIPEAAITLLATARIGAICWPLFSGFGPDALATRLLDAEARVLVTADGFFRRGALVRMKETADATATQVPTIEHLVVVRRADRTDVPWTPGRAVWWHEAVAAQPPTHTTVRTDADEPFLIIPTSGTTGKPKGTVHVHGGFPFKVAYDAGYCFDVQADDRVFWVSDMGWVMGPLALISSLTLGAAVLFYDGAIDFPAPDRLWSLIARHRITLFGTSPSAIRALAARGTDWVRQHDLSSLRVVSGSAEPWTADVWTWLFEEVGRGRCPMVNYSGGTEVGGGLVSAHVLSPQKPGSFVPVPGTAVDVFDEVGRPVRGEVGELVVKQPWPGMTRGFWRDPERYLETYWSRWPDVWVHGDWARIDADGFWYIEGRSDDTLKLAGKRVGPAEVETAALTDPRVLEAAAVGLPDPVKGEGLVVYVALRPPHEPDAVLREAVRAAVVERLGKALAPREVRFVAELPKTRSGKIMRRVIRAVALGQDPGDLSAMDNPAVAYAIREAR